MKTFIQKLFVFGLVVGISTTATELLSAGADRLNFKKIDKSTNCDIQADSSEYQFDTDWAMLKGNVAIKYGDIELRADTVRFNRVTGDAEAQGNVAFFSTTGDVWRGDSLKVNVFSGLAVSSKFDFYSDPVRVIADKGSVYTDENKNKEYMLDNAIVTTCTNAPGHFHYQVKTKRLCLRPEDEFVAQGAVPYLFGVPFFYWPYYWKDLNRHYGFRFEPGYGSDWGAFLLSSYKMVIYRNKESNTYVDSKTSIDFRSKRGFAFGEKILWNSNDKLTGWISAYYLDDKDLPYNVEDPERYRIRLNNEWEIAPRDRILAQAIYVSDDRFMEDFFEEEYDEMNQPDNFLSWTHIGDTYSGGVLARMRLNDFYTQVERLPEAWYNLNSTELFQSGIYFENNSTMSFLNKQFDERIWLGKEDPSYDVFRVDSDFVLTRPMKLMGFLSVVPRVGYRGTYYDKTKIVEEKIVTTTAEDGTVDSKTEKVAVEGDADFRNVFELGAELSFKAFSTWQDNQGFTWRHVVEPYTDLTLIPEPNLLPEQIYQFDEVDEIEESNTVRFGVRNRWQYKANNPQASVRELLYIDLYADFNLDATGEEDEFESLNLDLRFQPISWMKLYVEGEYEQEKSEVSEALFRLSVWHDAFKANVFYRYLVDESSLVSGVLTWNINPEWAASIYGRYEYETSRVEEVGTWIQRKFDCLAYRVYLTYEPSYTHLDGREEEEDFKVSFVLWLTGFEPDNLRELDDR